MNRLINNIISHLPIDDLDELVSSLCSERSEAEAICWNAADSNNDMLFRSPWLGKWRSHPVVAQQSDVPDRDVHGPWEGEDSLCCRVAVGGRFRWFSVWPWPVVVIRFIIRGCVCSRLPMLSTDFEFLWNSCFQELSELWKGLAQAFPANLPIIINYLYVITNLCADRLLHHVSILCGSVGLLEDVKVLFVGLLVCL